jgi:hypothetical protein
VTPCSQDPTLLVAVITPHRPLLGLDENLVAH